MERPSRFHYQPFYCEENAWWLCADPALGPGERFILFITTRAGLVPMLEQQVAPRGHLIAWDFHAVVVAGGRVWDLDSRLPLPTAGADWLAASFALADRLPAAYAPRLRFVSAEEYRRDFASDRSHMRDRRGRWRRPPPPWAPIGSGMNLDRYLSPEVPDPGLLLDLQGAADWLRSRTSAQPL